MFKKEHCKIKITHNPRDIYVVVLMGGWSVEREVSLNSGRNVEKALADLGYNVKSYDLTKDIAKFVEFLKYKPDIVFNALHGKFGEDGCIQALLDMLDIKYTHSGPDASLIAMNKILTKQILNGTNILKPHYILKLWHEIKDSHPMSPPYVVKPKDEGSSIGVIIVKEGDSPVGDKLSSWSYSEPIIVEEYIHGIEISASVLGEEALPVVSIHPKEGFYCYITKYTEDKADHIIPAKIPDHIYKLAQNTALQVHKVLNCKAVSRSDFIYDDKNDKLFFLEVNTQPGMTKLSIVPEVAAYTGVSYEELCSILIEKGLK